MSWEIYLFPFALLAFYFANQRLVKSIVRISYLLSLKEFVVSFFILGFVVSLPNFLFGVSSALKNVPVLSLGDVLGGNIVDLTLAIFLATLFTKNGISIREKVINQSLFFTAICAVFPLFLIADGTMTREDGLVLIFLFLIYLFWLFSKKERFEKIYLEEKELSFAKKIKQFFYELFLLFFLVFLLLISVQVIISFFIFLSKKLNLEIFFLGVSGIALLNCLPEIYFAILSAKRGKEDMLLGDLMSAIVGPATFVMGTVALLKPFSLSDIFVILITRVFLILSAFLFFIFSKTGKKITKIEGFLLFLVYLFFLIFEFSRAKITIPHS